MYRNSVARWKNYERHLRPLRQALAGGPASSAPQSMNG
jgi:hypothetical protein